MTEDQYKQYINKLESEALEWLMAYKSRLTVCKWFKLSYAPGDHSVAVYEDGRWRDVSNYHGAACALGMRRY